MKAKNILISLAGIGLIAAYFSCTNIEPYQQGAIFTKDNLKILQPGFYVTVPLIQNVQKIDMRMQSTTLSSIAVSTQDHNNVLLDVVVVWKVVDAGDYAKATQANSQQIDKWLSQAVSPVVQKALAQKTLSQLLGSSSNNLASQLLASLSQNAQQQGIQLIDINIQNISFAPNMLDKVYQAMQASSQQAVSQINAQGAQQAAQIAQQGKAAAASVLNDAMVQAATIKGQAEAQAQLIYNKAYQKDPQFYSFYRSMQLYQQVFSSKGTVLVVKPDGQFLKYLNSYKP